MIQPDTKTETKILTAEQVAEMLVDFDELETFIKGSASFSAGKDNEVILTVQVPK